MSDFLGRGEALKKCMKCKEGDAEARITIYMNIGGGEWNIDIFYLAICWAEL